MGGAVSPEEPCGSNSTSSHDKIILDNLKVHHSSVVRKWLAAHQSQIKVYYLQPYSQELNPDEYLNGALKERVHRGVRVRDMDGLKYKVRSFML